MFLFKHTTKILVHSRNLIQYEAGGAQGTMGRGQPLKRSPGLPDRSSGLTGRVTRLLVAGNIQL